MVARVAGSDPVRSTSTTSSPAALGRLFDKRFPWSNARKGLTHLPAPVNGARFPGEAGKIFAAIKTDNNYSTLKAYAVNVGDQKLLALTGSNGNPPSDFGLALFKSNGSQIAFKDAMGLGQWQINGKGSHFALAAGLPGFPKAGPVPTLHPGLSKLAALFEQQFPWSDDSGSINFPKSAVFNGTLPAHSDAFRMSRDNNGIQNGDYDYTEKYKVRVAGKDMYAVVGIADATYDVGLFDMKGERLMFNPGMEAGAWVP